MIKLMGKKIFTILHSKLLFNIWTYGYLKPFDKFQKNILARNLEANYWGQRSEFLRSLPHHLNSMYVRKEGSDKTANRPVLDFAAYQCVTTIQLAI